MSRWKLHHGDALPWLQSLDTGTVDAVITDPPYSSGGAAMRTASPLRKYGSSNSRYQSFDGDARDQRGYRAWLSLILADCLRAAAPGGILALFTDWRQLPTATDVVQVAGWTWRGIVPWVKPTARPQQGRPRQSAEFIVWGTAGARPLGGETHPGDYRTDPPRASQGRMHLTEKPLPVLRSLVRLVPEGGLVLDPFAGAGTTGAAALAERRRFVGAEISDHYYEAAAARLRAAAESTSPPSTDR